MATEGQKAVLTVDQLETYLWSAADILRGFIDSSESTLICYKGPAAGEQHP